MEAQLVEEMPFTSKRCGLVTTTTRVYLGGRGKVKHLRIAITCVAHAMCGVTETDCSCTASISSQNSEHCKFEFNQVMNASWMTIPDQFPVVTPDYTQRPTIIPRSSDVSDLQ